MSSFYLCSALVRLLPLALARLAIALLSLSMTLMSGAARLDPAAAADTEEEDPETFDAPKLRIEAGMHVDEVRSVSANAEGDLILTASADKTARLWERSSGRLLRILRPPIASKMDGAMQAGALSPNGKIAAVGGWTGPAQATADRKSFCCYFFATRNGRLQRRIEGLPDAITQIAFSPDGKHVAIGCSSGGIGIWEVTTAREIGRDPDYPETCYGLTWCGNEKLATTSWDGLVRLYDKVLSRPPGVNVFPTRTKTRNGYQATDRAAMPFPLDNATSSHGLPLAWKMMGGISCSPDGKTLAIGFLDRVDMVLLSADNLAFLRQPDVGEASNGALSEVSWSADGRYLAAAGFLEHPSPANQGKNVVVRIWKDQGKTFVADLPVSSQTINHLAPLPVKAGGGWLYGTSMPSWGVANLEKSAPTQQIGRAPIADFTGLAEVLGTTADGRCVQLHMKRGDIKEALFDVKSRRLIASATEVDEKSKKSLLFERPLLEPRITGVAMTEWRRSPAPKWHGEPKPLEVGEICNCLAVSPDASCFMVGTNLRLICAEPTGDNPWRKTVSSPILAINFSGDGQVIIVAYGDGSIRWHCVSDGREILAFFMHADGKRWVLWTPEGYYDCSPGGEDLIGWHFNNGRDKAADFFAASRFRRIFYRPDVIDQVLQVGVNDSVKALQIADQVRHEQDPAFEITDPKELAKLLRDISPPVVEMDTGGDHRRVEINGSDTSLKLHYQVRQTGARPAAKIVLRFNGRLIGTEEAKSDEPADVVLPQGLAGELSAFATVEDEKGKTLRLANRPSCGSIANRGGLALDSLGCSLSRSEFPAPNPRDGPADSSSFRRQPTTRRESLTFWTGSEVFSLQSKRAALQTRRSDRHSRTVKRPSRRLKSN